MTAEAGTVTSTKRGAGGTGATSGSRDGSGAGGSAGADVLAALSFALLLPEPTDAGPDAAVVVSG